MAQPQRIVILGGGFAGAFCAQRLARLLGRDEAEVTLVDRHNYFAFTPLLIEAGIGSLEPRHTIVPIRSFIGRSKFLMGEATAVDCDAQRVTVRVGGERERTVEYEHLVLALGTVSEPPDAPGLERAMPIKHLADAVALRDRAVRMLEMACVEPDEAVRRRLLHFVVIGGNYTGVEVAGEFHAFLQRAATRYDGLDPTEVGVTLLELMDRLLPALDPGLADYAAATLEKRGVDVRCEDTIDSCDGHRYTLKSGKEIEARTLIWAAGNAPNPLCGSIDLPKDEKGYFKAEPDMRIEGCRNTWGVGDCAINPDPEGEPYPPTAQLAVRQGKAVAANIARDPGRGDAGARLRAAGHARGPGAANRRGEGLRRARERVRGVVAVADGVPAEDARDRTQTPRRDGLDAGSLHPPGHRRAGHRRACGARGRRGRAARSGGRGGVRGGVQGGGRRRRVAAA